MSVLNITPLRLLCRQERQKEEKKAKIGYHFKNIGHISCACTRGIYVCARYEVSPDDDNDDTRRPNS